MDTPYIIVIAGPNGAGKSTFAKWFLADLPDCAGIVDPDAIARDLNITDEAQRNLAAGRIALDTIDANIRNGISFAIETTLSGKTLALRLESAQRAGFSVKIAVLWVPSVRLTSERVRVRVSEGGHGIPEEIQFRRFERTYINFFDIYESRCHEWSLFYAIPRPPREIARGSGGFSEE
jgi:predicted ABC-type ATPase